MEPKFKVGDVVILHMNHIEPEGYCQKCGLYYPEDMYKYNLKKAVITNSRNEYGYIYYEIQILSDAWKPNYCWCEHTLKHAENWRVV